MSSVFSVYDGEEQMRTGGARSALMQLARLLHLQMRNNPPIEIECGTEGEFDNARDASRRSFLNMFVLNLVTGHGELPDRQTMRRNNYAIRRSNAIFVISEMVHRATNLRYQGALSSYVLALHATPELKARGDGLAKLCLTSNGAGKNRVRDEAVKTSWIKNGGSDTVDAILDLESGGLVMGMVDNMGNRRSAKDGNGFVQKTLGMFRVTSRDALRFAGGPRVCVCACVCVIGRGRERERERQSNSEKELYTYIDRERERERDRERQREREREREKDRGRDRERK